MPMTGLGALCNINYHPLPSFLLRVSRFFLYLLSGFSMRQLLHFFDALSIIRTKPLRPQLHPQIRPEDKSHTRNAA
ncbi:hypothetical protein HBI80_185000 [Parastagonospora nodorum]|nr:hypothetical protein HBI80_185000 [Parastagonospora nodorum]KAH5030194.1 hypothetical protein HBI74_097020 [Parastagonospora nodorum]KAH5256061.1 hypothetical protein HBI72_132230 [Parastagonospora nodorum]KAH6494359.1 hypothetical protein HBI55_113440 [Parastagonospora nodorum]